MNPVIVVESGSKTKTLRHLLQGEYDAVACGGHIIKMPDDRLGIDVENDFDYEIEPMVYRGQDQVEAMQDKLSDYDEIYIATDPDREGEAIASDLIEHCVPEDADVQRIEYNSIDYPTVMEALENPRSINENRVEAQRARRTLDRLVGFVLSSMAQFDPDGPGLPSVGRVLSPAVSLVVDREDEIQGFTPRKFWIVRSELEVDEDADEFMEVQLDEDWDEFEDAKEAVEELDEASAFDVHKVDIDPEDEQNPPPPYTTDSLQDEVDQLLGYTPEQTLEIAQELYQGVEIDGSPQALITYMRTDSTRVAPAALNMAKEALTQQLGEEYYQGRSWEPSGEAQDAHEAIRPTSASEPELAPDEIQDDLTEQQYQVYRLIYYRFLSSQMVPAVYETTKIELQGGSRQAIARGSLLQKPGFLRYFQEVREGAGREEVDLPDVEEGQRLPIERAWPEPEQTYPPGRYREGSLVSELKQRGIGRPSTFSDIMQKIKKSGQGYGYVRKIPRSGNLRPTDRGEALCEYLRNNYEQVISYEYTAKMEEELEKIEHGEANYEEFLQQEFEWLEEPFKEAREQGWLDGDLPTPAQVRFLRSLEDQTGHDVPEDVFQNRERVSEWIDKLQDEVAPEVRIGAIHKADVGGVTCERFRVYFNHPLPDEEWDYLRDHKMKYRHGNEENPPSFQFQRQNPERVQTLRDDLIDRYTDDESPLDDEVNVLVDDSS